MTEKYEEGYDRHTTCKRIIKINNVNLPIYWSLGDPLTQYVRGLSSYQKKEIPSKGETKAHEPKLKQSPTPNAIEFVVLSQLASDDSDDLIRLSTALRRGVLQAQVSNWVKLPSPLFVTNKLEEYMGL